MKILHALHNYPPEFRGGIERVVEELVAAQRRAGHEAVVLSGSESAGVAPELRRETHDGVVVLRLVRGRGLRDPIDTFRAELAALVDAALEEVRPDVLHLHHWLNLGNDVVRRAARRRVPALVTLHDSYATCGLVFRLPDGKTPCDLEQSEGHCVPCIGGRSAVDREEVRFRVGMRKAALRAELLAAAAVTAPSSAHVTALRPHLPPGLPVHVVPPGSPALAPVTPRPRRGPLRVLHFGNLCRLKGAELLGGAVAAAASGGAAIRLTLAGAIVEPGLATGPAVLAGPFDAAGLRELAADADVAAFPSLARESYSLVVDEALRLGLPVMVSDRGALGERIGGRGCVLPAGDQRAWAVALARYAAVPEDLDRMRRAAHGPLATPDDHARRTIELARGARVPRGADLDLETPLLARLAHFERRLTDYTEGLHRDGAR
jgi:glycosyltransferase involved in cell wall biosynthesis